LLCLLRIFRKFNENFKNLGAWAQPINKLLDEDKRLGLLMSTVALLYGIVKLSDPTKFQVCVGKTIDVLRKIHSYKWRRNHRHESYFYKEVPHPWI